MPFRPGMLRSSRTMSGSSSRASRIPVSGSPASPISVMSSSSSSSWETPRRSSGWSSMIRMLAGASGVLSVMPGSVPVPVVVGGDGVEARVDGGGGHAGLAHVSADQARGLRGEDQLDPGAAALAIAQGEAAAQGLGAVAHDHQPVVHGRRAVVRQADAVILDDGMHPGGAEADR